MTERATCWSITINNPTPEDFSRLSNLPPGWKVKGQIECGGKQATEHAQCMLLTPQIRFAAVKKHLPRAHIEVARSKAALTKYVQKSDTRVAELPDYEGLTAFMLTDLVLDAWDEDEFQRMSVSCRWDSPHLSYADYVVKCLIEKGERRGIEYVAINPMWRSAWKRFGAAIVARGKISVDSINAPSYAQGKEACEPQGEAGSVVSAEEPDGECNRVI